MITHLAPKWGALLLFPEARYYGKSLPFGSGSYTAEHFKYLSTEQILKDYVDILAHVKETNPGAKNCPVVSFGGSYGGTLTTFLRATYPEAVVGGLAASAPIGYYDPEGWDAHGVTALTWSEIVQKDYREAHEGCIPAIKRAIEVSSTLTLTLTWILTLTRI